MTDLQIIALIVSVIILIFGTVYLYLYYKNKGITDEKVLLSVPDLVFALGGESNIVSSSLENKRLKILLVDPKLVLRSKLKSMEVPAFLTGKEIKLLVKDNPVRIKSMLDQIISEVEK